MSPVLSVSCLSGLLIDPHICSLSKSCFCRRSRMVVFDVPELLQSGFVRQEGRAHDLGPRFVREACAIIFVVCSDVSSQRSSYLSRSQLSKICITNQSAVLPKLWLDTNLIVNGRKLVLAQFLEIIIHVLVWQVTANKDARYFASGLIGQVL